MGKIFLVDVYPEVGYGDEPVAIMVPQNACPSCGYKDTLIIQHIDMKPKFVSKGIVYCKCLMCQAKSTAYVRDMKGIMKGNEGISDIQN